MKIEPIEKPQTHKTSLEASGELKTLKGSIVEVQQVSQPPSEATPSIVSVKQRNLNKFKVVLDSRQFNVTDEDMQMEKSEREQGEKSEKEENSIKQSQIS